MSYAPSSIQKLRNYLIDEYNCPGNGVGIIGNPQTHFNGYHLGWDRIRVNEGWNDYSVRHKRDRNPTDASMAIDIPMFSRGRMNLRNLSLWIVAQMQADAPDTRDIREIIYSPDGKVVKHWDDVNGWTKHDPDSHRSHTHISFYRDSEGRSKLALFERYMVEMAGLTKADVNTLVNTDGVIAVPDTAKPTENKYWTLSGLLRNIRDLVFNGLKTVKQDQGVMISMVVDNHREVLAKLNDVMAHPPVVHNHYTMQPTDEQWNAFLDRVSGN